jgi:hypothetical protein
MSAPAIGSFLKLLFPSGSPTGYRFQNFTAGRTLIWSGENYVYAGFGYSGGSTDASASAVSGSLLMALNDLSLTVFGTAANDRWLAEISTVWLDGEPLEPVSLWMKDTFEILAVGHNGVEKVSVSLGSPLAAVGYEIPRLRLTQAMVGSLPPTGNVPL